MEAFEEIKELIEEQKSFVLEAGAGSGKTYTLIQTINYLLDKKGKELKKRNQRVVCITFTNVAKNNIINRIENNPLVIVSTIHEFLWSCIKKFNKQLVYELDKLNERFCQEKPGKGFEPNLKDRIVEVIYDDSGYRDFEKGKLHHDDVISLSYQMFKNYISLTSIIAQKYPYVLIDEYQDTATETVDGIINYLLSRNMNTFLVGFYGDSYQKIYDEGVGELNNFINTGKLHLVTKKENYRSSVAVVSLLNKVRDNIIQTIPEGKNRPSGSVKFINCLYPGVEQKEKATDYKIRIAPQKETNYNKVIKQLESDGWNFLEGGDDKIIILANSKVAQRAGFESLYKLYNTRYKLSARERLLKREDKFASFFMGSIDKKTSVERESGVEHLSKMWNSKDYNGVIHYLKTYGNYNILSNHQQKRNIESKLNHLLALRNIGSVEDVMDFCISEQIIKPSKSITEFLINLKVDIDTIKDDQLREKLINDSKFYKELMKLSYKEFINAFIYIQDQSVYSTQHGTKGEEYRNVLMVIDDTSWPQMYNFNNFFNRSEEIKERELRTRNLFYVSCSRAKENLLVLALSEMDKNAIFTIDHFFEKKIELLNWQ